MAKLNLVKTDPDKEKGVWVPYELDIELKIARVGNAKFDELVRRLAEPTLKEQRAKAKKMAEDPLGDEIIMKAAAKHLLVDWKHIEDEEGKPIKYSAAKALELFQDPGLRDLYKFVMATSGESERYRMELDEESAGN